MNRDQYQPGAPAKVEAKHDGEKWTLVFTRELKHAPESVWSALTDPAELREWAPFDADHNLGSKGEATLTMAGGSGGADDQSKSTIRIADRPRVLEYTWGNDVLRWELEPNGTGTRLTLKHTVEDSSWLPMVAAGWHICIDVMDLYLSGQPIGRIVADEAKQHGWQRLHDAYAEQVS